MPFLANHNLILTLSDVGLGMITLGISNVAYRHACNMSEGTNETQNALTNAHIWNLYIVAAAGAVASTLLISKALLNVKK